jgi:hypothetical protein
MEIKKLNEIMMKKEEGMRFWNLMMMISMKMRFPACQSKRVAGCTEAGFAFW